MGEELAGPELELRKMARNAWEQLVRRQPPSSPLWQHGGCTHGRCRRPDGSSLHPKTIKAVAYALATWANPDGTNAHPGIGSPRRRGAPADPHEPETRGLMLATASSKLTVIAAIAHLRTVGLVAVQAHAGRRGVPRSFATVYCLTSPPIENIIPTSREEAAIHDWFTAQETEPKPADQATWPPV